MNVQIVDRAAEIHCISFLPARMREFRGEERNWWLAEAWVEIRFQGR